MTPEPRTTSKYELPRGASVGKYEILRKIATGGMAEIYLARSRGTAGFEKLVVLKRILPQVAEDPDFVQMFLDEARLSSTLQHPNIADVYDVGEADGQYFFTMEFVYGQDCRTIRHEMKKRAEPVPLAVALAIVHGTASALDHAHDKRGPDGKMLGLVHRDVSASNIMVSYDGAVKLLDFGIARVMSTTHKTQVGTLKGKIPYMSPEQCKGLPLDRRSDLFSLGVVLFELTVGRRPFRGDSDFAIMDQIVYQGAPTPSSLMTGYPAELEAIVMKCLDRDPKARFNTGDELVEELEAFTQKYSLWISPKQLGKYMRTVFADRIQAWEAAEAAGVPFTQHVSESITSQSQQSDLMTPPSAFPALPARASQVMAAQSPEVAASLRPTPTSMQAADPAKSIDELHAPLGKKVPPKSPTRQILAVTAESLAKLTQQTAPPAPAAKVAPPTPARAPSPSPARTPSSPPPSARAPSPPPASARPPSPAPYTPPAQLPFQSPDKAGDGWDAPTTRFEGEPEFANEAPTRSQPEEDLARALAADPDAGATLRAPTAVDDAAATFQGMKRAPVDDAAATFQGMKAASAAKAPAKTLYGAPPAPSYVPRSEFGDDQATRRAPSPAGLTPRPELPDDQATKRAPAPAGLRARSEIDDEQITEKPVQIARPFVPDPAAVQAPAPALQSAPVPSLKPSGSKAVLFALAGVLLVGAGIAGYVIVAGGGSSTAASTSVDQGSEVRARPTPVEPTRPAVAPEPANPAVAPEPAKPDSAKPEPAKPEVAKPEPAKPESAKPEPAKPEVAKPEPAKPESAKPEPATPAPHVIRKPVRPVAKPPVVTPKHTKPEAGSSKDATWDPNSPFLPQ